MLSRRQAIGLLAGGAPALKVARADAGVQLDIMPGPFKGTRESLKDWQVPAWYRDAKFGIWAHWGPQSAPEYGDWYARNMYIQGQRQYNYHVKTYGHPTKFGFKDVIPIWKADKFDPEQLIALYKKAGARYFCSMGVHHDGFDLWKSVHQPRWNAVAIGPKRDVVGLWKKAAQKAGLRFAVSEHLAPSYHWFSPSHTSDKTGPLAGVAYDGADPAYADLYHDLPKDYPYGRRVNDREAPDPWKLHYFKRIKDLVDNYQPDLLYTDGDIFFQEYGLALVANHYNTSARIHGGRCEAVYTSKLASDCETGTCVLDWERGVAAGIPANPWQTDTCIGNWHYDKEAVYKTPKRVIDMLVDILSRNGNLMLNFPLPNSGMLDEQELKILDEITKWMAVNSEGIYSTRPWKTFGDGPVATAPPSGRGARFNEVGRRDFTAEEVRFTTKGSTLYAFVMGWPEKQAVIQPLATTSRVVQVKVKNVELLGFKGKVKWTQDEKGLTAQTPGDASSLSDALERLHPLWLDEPCDLTSLTAIRKISEERVTALGFGRSLTRPAEFQELLREDVIDVFRPDLARNGITQIRKCAALAETNYVAVAPYHDGGPIGTAAALHLAASLPNFFAQQVPLPAAEEDRRFRAALAGTSLETVTDGYLALPTAPGLGLQIDASLVGKEVA